MIAESVVATDTTCARCGKALAPGAGLQGEPLITAMQLAGTIARTAVKAPGTLGDVLLKPLPQVTYCADCREVVSERRQAEQMKFLVGVVLLVVLLIGVPVWLLMG